MSYLFLNQKELVWVPEGRATAAPKDWRALQDDILSSTVLNSADDQGGNLFFKSYMQAQTGLHKC